MHASLNAAVPSPYTSSVEKTRLSFHDESMWWNCKLKTSQFLILLLHNFSRQCLDGV